MKLMFGATMRRGRLGAIMVTDQEPPSKRSLIGASRSFGNLKRFQ